MITAYRSERNPEEKSLTKNTDRRLWKELRPVLIELGFNTKPWERNEFIENKTALVSLDNKIYTLVVLSPSINDIQFRGPNGELIAKYRNTLEDFIGQIRLHVQGLKEGHDSGIRS